MIDPSRLTRSELDAETLARQDPDYVAGLAPRSYESLRREQIADVEDSDLIDLEARSASYYAHLMRVQAEREASSRRFLRGLAWVSAAIVLGIGWWLLLLSLSGLWMQL